MWISRREYNNLIEELNHLRGREREIEDLIGKYRSVPELTSQIDDLQREIDRLTEERNRLDIELQLATSHLKKLDTSIDMESLQLVQLLKKGD